MIDLNTSANIQYNNENGVFIMNGASPYSVYYNSNCYGLYYNTTNGGGGKRPEIHLNDSLQNDHFKHDMIINASRMYCYCYNLTGQPVCGDNVVNASYMYAYCNKLTGQPVCKNNIVDADHMYAYCRYITGSPVCGNNVVNASYMYYNCKSLTGTPVVGPKVTNADHMYSNCNQYTTAVVTPGLKNLAYMYANTSVTDVTISGGSWSSTNFDNVAGFYYNCPVTSAGAPHAPNCQYKYAYSRIASPTISSGTVNAKGMFSGCTYLTGSLQGATGYTTDASYMFANSSVPEMRFFNDMVNCAYMYYNCTNLSTAIAVVPTSVLNVYNMVAGVEVNSRKSVYLRVTKWSFIWNCIFNNSTNGQLVGTPLSFSDSSSLYFVNNEYKIYILNI